MIKDFDDTGGGNTLAEIPRASEIMKLGSKNTEVSRDSKYSKRSKATV